MILENLGNYLFFLRSMFGNMVHYRMLLARILDECIAVGVNSLFIVGIISIFMGGATCLQLAAQLSHLPFIFGTELVGLSVRNMTITELAPTVIGIVFTGKICSSIASELGSMRISEQIDALEIMGVNAANYLVFPKIIANIFMYPLLVIISMFLCMGGGYIACKFLTDIAPHDYESGLKLMFDPYDVYVALCKATVYAFILSSIACYKGFTARGGALDVGQASTDAVTNSCMAILIADVILVYVLLGHRI